MALTQLHPTALPGGRYGSFAGKAAASGDGPHNPGTITQLHPTALPGGRYGSFVGKEATEEAAVGGLRRIKSFRRYLARKGKEAKRVEEKIARLEARRERIVEAAQSAPGVGPDLAPIMTKLSALRATLAAIEANAAVIRERLEDDEEDDEILLLM